MSFSAGLHAWAFTLTTFAQMYAAKFGTDESKMMNKLWGDNFFDPATKKWTSKATDSKTCLRGFVQFCYNPIKQVGRMEGHRSSASSHMEQMVGWQQMVGWSMQRCTCCCMGTHRLDEVRGKCFLGWSVVRKTALQTGFAWLA